MGELKACPFCGGDTAEINQTGKTELTLRCRRGCISYKQRILRMTLEKLEECMTKSWNTRPLTAELEAEKKELEKLVKAYFKRETELEEEVERLKGEFDEALSEVLFQGNKVADLQKRIGEIKKFVDKKIDTGLITGFIPLGWEELRNKILTDKGEG